MKIIAFSDTHTKHKQIVVPNGDILIHCGDATNRGTLLEFFDFINWYSSLPHANKIYVGGNHDLGLCNENRDIILSEFENKGIIYLENSGICINGLTIWGSPYTPKFHDWAFMKERGKDIRRVWNEIPKKLDILITHGPPHNILDLNRSGTHCGCRDLKNAICQKKPKIHLFGHIHESVGLDRVNGIELYNVAQVDVYHQLVYKPLVLELGE